jgi:hypothetical protein
MEPPIPRIGIAIYDLNGTFSQEKKLVKEGNQVIIGYAYIPDKLTI